MLKLQYFDFLNKEKGIIEDTTFISGLDSDYKQNVMDFMNLEVELGLLKKPLTEEQIFYEA